ncbi:hypothetical protein G9A89_016374 [Geosiphon pyriformis]|nr:hypothetical protein G9A89_016374 [Geosiphon pyriformis]
MSEPLFKKQKRATVNDALHKEIYDIVAYFNHKYPELHISRPTVSKIIKEHAKWLNIEIDEISERSIRHKSVKFPLLNQALSYWVEQVTAATIEFNDQLIKEKGKEFAKLLGMHENEMQFSNGWVQKFKNETNYVFTDFMDQIKHLQNVEMQEKIVTPVTIQNCWQKTDILFYNQELEIQESETSIAMDIFNNLPSNAQQLVKNLEDYTIAVDELLATENILDDNEIVDMVLADAQIEINTINDSEEL